MGGIFRGIRKPMASKSMGAQRFKSGGIVNYEYNPYKSHSWDRYTPAQREAFVPKTIEEDDAVVVDNNTTNTGGGSTNTGIVTPVDTTPTTTVYDNPFAVDDTPKWAEPESALVPGNDDFSWDGAGGTSYGGDYQTVIDAAHDLPAVTTDSGGNPVPVSAGNFTPVTAYAPEIGDVVDNETMREIQNAEVERSFENYGENILNNPDLTPEQKAAANPAFNVGASETHAQVPVTITNTETGDSYTKPAGSLTSEDFANALPGDGTSNAITIGELPGANLTLAGNILSDVEIPFTGGDTGGNYTGVVDDYGYIDSSQGGFSGPGTGDNEDLIARQYELAGQSAAAAGVRNIGGSYAQDGIGSGNAPIVETRYNPATGLSEVIGIEEQERAIAASNNDGNPNNDVGNAGWGFTSFGDLFDGGGAGASGDSYTGGIHGDNTVGSTISDAQAQQNIADLQAFSSATANRGQAEGKAAAATKQANEYVNEQAELKAGASEEELAAIEQDQLLGDFLWKYEGADTPQMKAAYAARAKEAGLDFGGQSASDFVTSDAVAGKDKDKLKADARAAKTAADQGIKAVDGGLQTPKTTADTALGTDVLASGLTRDETTAANQQTIDAHNAQFSSGEREQREANAKAKVDEAKAEEAGLNSLNGEEAKAWLNERGLGNFAKEDARDALAGAIYDGTAFAAIEAAQDLNRGGIVHRAEGGKINIKPSRKGIFSKKAKDAGQGTQEYARKIMTAKKGIYSPSLRKQANFALNASKWN